MENKKVLFITGAGSGMGQLAAQRALDAGWAVAAMDINAAGLDNLRGEPAVLLKLVVDITDTLAVADAVQQAESTLGSIDRLINAAAIMPLGLLTDQTPALVLRIMAINYGGLVNITQAVLPRMLQRGRGENSSASRQWPAICRRFTWVLTMRPNLPSTPSPKCFITKIGRVVCAFCAYVRLWWQRRCCGRRKIRCGQNYSTRAPRFSPKK